MATLNSFILLTLIIAVSADNNINTSNTVETPTWTTNTTLRTTATTTPGIIMSTIITTQAEPSDSKEPETTVATATLPSKEEKPEDVDAPQSTTTEDTKTPTVTQQEAIDNEETATCALDQPHIEASTKETTTTKKTTTKETTPNASTSNGPIPKETTSKESPTVEPTPPKETTPSVTEPPRKPSLMHRMKFHGQHNHLTSIEETHSEEEKPQGPIPCTCGVFLSGQFKRGSKEQPKGVPVLTQEMDTPFMNNAMGNRQCTNKCLELIIKHLPKSGEIICATVDREHVFKERAYLFIKNHSDKWHGTNLSAGREFCCRDNEPYKCPVN